MSRSTGDDINLDGVNPQAEVFPPDEGMTWFGNDSSDLFIKPEVTSEERDEPRRSGKRLRSLPVGSLDREAKTGIPGLDEWMHFFCNSVIKVATDFYIDLAFRGIDEEWLSDREVQRIKLDEDERKRIGRPFAEYAYKNKFMRKHGRSIIAAADSIDAVIQLGMWYSRVNRIADKYKRMMNGQQPRHGNFRFEPPRAPEPQARREEGETSERPRQGEESRTNGDHKWRPRVEGTVFRNFDG